MGTKHTRAMTPADRSRLYACEEKIESGLGTFFEVGNALLEIRDGRLYRADFKTFEDYCRDRWKFGASRARQLIGAAKTAARVKSVTSGNTPDSGSKLPNERQTRALASDLKALDKEIENLPPEKQVEAFKREEKKVLDRMARQIGGEDRARRLAKVQRGIKAAKTAAKGLGDEAEPGIELLEKAALFFSTLPQE